MIEYKLARPIHAGRIKEIKHEIGDTMFKVLLHDGSFRMMTETWIDSWKPKTGEWLLALLDDSFAVADPKTFSALFVKV